MSCPLQNSKANKKSEELAVDRIKSVFGTAVNQA
jgi:hypothetical protein